MSRDKCGLHYGYYHEYLTVLKKCHYAYSHTFYKMVLFSKRLFSEFISMVVACMGSWSWVVVSLPCSYKKNKTKNKKPLSHYFGGSLAKIISLKENLSAWSTVTDISGCGCKSHSHPILLSPGARLFAFLATRWDIIHKKAGKVWEKPSTNNFQHSPETGLWCEGIDLKSFI